MFGALCLLDCWLRRSGVSNTINTSFVERNNGTDRHQNSRKRRKTYAFSKDLAMHRAASYFIGYSDNFRWPVRTLRAREAEGPWQARTPAMAAGLSDHVWSTKEWITCPAKPRQLPSGTTPISLLCTNIPPTFKMPTGAPADSGKLFRLRVERVIGSIPPRRPA